ncbi:redoxin domain-containing protein [Deltaproteobacteria bacterium TL4]
MAYSNTPKVGQAALDFVSVMSDRSEFQLKHALAQGNHILLVFYRGHWCLFCVSQLTELKNNHSIIEHYNTRVYALSVDSPEQSQAMRDSMQLPFDLLCDEEKQVIQLYDLYNHHEQQGIAYPAVLIIDAEGIIRYRSLEKTVKRVNFSEVLDFLETLQKDPNAQQEGENLISVIPSYDELYQLAQNLLKQGSKANWIHYLTYPAVFAKMSHRLVSGTYRFKLRARIHAPAENIFDYVTEPELMSEWLGVKLTRIVDSPKANTHPNDVGSVRLVSVGPITFEETVTVYDPPLRSEYTISKGSPFRDYQGKVEITPKGAQCEVVWTVSFDSKIPYSAVLLGKILKTSFEMGLKKLTNFF